MMPSQFPKIILDIGSNHNQDFDRLEKMITSLPFGIWGVKLQDFDPDTLYREGKNKEALQKAQLPKNWDLQKIQELCHKNGIRFGMTPFNEAALDRLSRGNCDFIKISSFDAARTSFVKKAIDKCNVDALCFFISTGLISLQEIEQIKSMLQNKNNGIPLSGMFHCISEYPTREDECNTSFLLNLKVLRAGIGDYSPGFSTHCVNAVPILSALVYGAGIIEIHYDLDEQGREFGHGHCWLPKQIEQLIETISNFIDCQGLGNIEHQQYVRDHQHLRADPKDGMRPTRKGG